MIEQSIADFVVGVLVLLVGGALTAPYFLKNLRRWVKARDQAPAEEVLFTILVADLANDPDRRQTRHIVHALEDQLDALAQGSSIRVRGFTRQLDIDPWDDQANARELAERRGREWLQSQNADLLVWGDVVAADQVLRLRFVARDIGSRSATTYRLNDRIQLPLDFGRDLSALLSGAALAAASPVFDRPGQALAATLQPLYPKLQALTLSFPATFGPSDRLRAFMAAGFVATQLGDELGQVKYLRDARDNFREAARIAEQERYTDLAGSIQNNLGIALGELSKLTGDLQDMTDAMAAFQAALSSWGNTAEADQVIAAKVNLANTISRMSEHRHDPSGFRAAIQILEEVMGCWPRDLGVVEKASAANCLANARLRLSQLLQDPELLAQAAADLEATLVALPPAELPLYWATTQSNLGNIYAARSAFSSNQSDDLERAANAYQHALSKQSRDQVPLDWSLSANGLAIVEAQRGELAKSAQKLRVAIALWRQVLDVRAKCEAKLLWAQSACNLGNALVSLAGLVEGERIILASEALRLHHEARQAFLDLGANSLVEISDKLIARANGRLKDGRA